MTAAPLACVTLPSALLFPSLTGQCILTHMEIALCNRVVPRTRNIHNADVKTKKNTPFLLSHQSSPQTDFLFGEHSSRSLLCLLDINAKRTSSSLDCPTSCKQSV